MPPALENIQRQKSGWAPFLSRLRAVFEDMDRKYRQTSGRYGFTCRGCEDNCCLTRFYHYTYLEYLFFLEGFSTLSREEQHLLKTRAGAVCQETVHAEHSKEPVRLMCPVNSGGLCRLYAYRPMICRLHGIPFELHPPGQRAIYSPGCECFTSQCARMDYIEFDRTPFYVRLSKLEGELKRELNLARKFKMTLAEMLQDFNCGSQIRP